VRTLRGIGLQGKASTGIGHCGQTRSSVRVNDQTKAASLPLMAVPASACDSPPESRVFAARSALRAFTSQRQKLALSVCRKGKLLCRRFGALAKSCKQRAVISVSVSVWLMIIHISPCSRHKRPGSHLDIGGCGDMRPCTVSVRKNLRATTPPIAAE